MNVNKVNNAFNTLIEYMTISEIAFYIMSGTGLDDENVKTIYEAYKKDNDELLRFLVNNFG